jgi:hypothetical protein
VFILLKLKNAKYIIKEDISLLILRMVKHN